MLKALQLVQEELGADAIVVSTREVPTGPSWNPWKQSAVEIVATTSDTIPDTRKPVQKPAPQPAPVKPAQNQPGIDFVEEIPDIEWVNDAPAASTSKARKQAASFKPWEPAPAEKKPDQPDPIPHRLTPAQTAPVPARPAPAPRKSPAKPGVEDSGLPAGLKKIFSQLNYQGVDRSLVNGLMDVALETLSPNTLADKEMCKKYITQLLGAELRVQQGLGVYVTSNIVAMVGPSGSGKTSALAKLALFYSRHMEKTITWVCADTVRIGAIAEARAYTDALGIDLKLVYKPEDLKEIMQSAHDNDIFLLDTPGYNPCSENQMVELGALLAAIPKRCTYLVSSATTKETDLTQLIASFGVFNLDGLIITKLDETHVFGSVYNYARKNQVPLGFFATGKEPADSLEVADPARLVSALFGTEWTK
jgi:flagellar biosynthesis protein FlhF